MANVGYTSAQWHGGSTDDPQHRLQPGSPHYWFWTGLSGREAVSVSACPLQQRQSAALAVENVYFRLEGASLSDGPTLRFTVRNTGTIPIDFYTVSIGFVTA